MYMYLHDSTTEKSVEELKVEKAFQRVQQKDKKWKILTQNISYRFQIRSSSKETVKALF